MMDKSLWALWGMLMLMPWPAFATEVPLIGAYPTTQDIDNASEAIDCRTPNRYQTVRVQHASAGDVTITVNPSILEGTSAGQRCTICGAHASNTVTLQDNLGVDLSVDGSSIIFVDDSSVAQVCADFVWTGSVWRQLGGAATGADDQTAAEVPFTPAGSVGASDVQAAIEEVAAEGVTFLSHATSCPDNITTATLGDTCLDLDESGTEPGRQKLWTCTLPGNDVGAGSASFCDEPGNWTGGTALALDGDQTLTYLLSDGSKVIRYCNDTDYDSATFCHEWTIDPVSGPSYSGVCGFSTPGDPTTPLPCDTEISVASGKDWALSYAGDPILQMAAGSNDVRPTTDGWLSPRSGTAAPDSADCNAAGEAGRVYIETDQADGQQIWVCDGSGWRQQGLIEDEEWFDAAGCNNATAGHIWDAPTSNAPNPVCEGTNFRKAVLEFDATTDESIYFKFRLPAGYNATLGMDFIIRWKAAATSAETTWCVELARVAVGSTSDPSLPGQAAGNCEADTAQGTTLQENEVTIAGVTCTSCVAGDLVYGRLSRDADQTLGAGNDDMSGDALLIGWTRIMRRAK